MNRKNPTLKVMDEPQYIICGEKNEVEIFNDAPSEIVKTVIDLAEASNYTVRFIMGDIICPVCGKNLHRNGCGDPYWNKKNFVKTQNYYHRKCETKKYTHLYKYKNKYCCYTKDIEYNGFNYNLMNYNSYYSKREIMIFYEDVNVPVSTIFYHCEKTFEEFYEYLQEEQRRKLEELRIKPSGIYCYDEQYIFISKTLYMRMTIIDSKNKLIIGDELVKYEDFDDETIQKFLEEKLEDLPIKAIITDGRNSYKSIIETIGAIHHRCCYCSKSS